ncbi:hypothetical protein [Vibrio mediterranei]|uniref:hypothetical protein n=1 Tax=Vibrio mediterranei TaxID=689 RepID=UPI001EFD319E|nr:hypothetical protein [Vibrio mediterranei]MCG9659576.1 hypothetical protein [Vibrio mediterranei]
MIRLARKDTPSHGIKVPSMVQSSELSTLGVSNMNSNVFGIDIAKQVFQIHWVDQETGEIHSDKVKRKDRYYVKTRGLFKEVLEHYYSKGDGKKKNHSDEYKQHQGIDLSICAKWIKDTSTHFPRERKKRLELCSKKLSSHIQFMNGVVHGQQLVGSDGQVQAIRNETLELLEFLVLAESPSSSSSLGVTAT